MPPANKIRTCPVCGKDDRLTRDHLVPSWFIRRINYFGISHMEVLINAGWKTEPLFDNVCHDCNVSKGGIIDWDHWIVRKYMQSFIELCQKKIDRTRFPTKVLIVCKCKECTQIDKFNDRVKKTEEIMQEVKATHAGTPESPEDWARRRFKIADQKA